MATKATTKKTTASKPKKAAKAIKTADKKSTMASVTAVPVGEKLQIIAEFATKKGDTGSPEVQIALLSKRIDKLVAHLKSNPSDNHSRRGLLGMVSKRRRLVNYLASKNSARAKAISAKLKLV